MQKNKKSFAYTLKSRWQLWVLAGPFLLLFFLMTVVPVLSSIVLSFTSFDMVSMPSFTGFANYIRMFLHDDIFPTVFKNTILLAILTGPAGFILSFVLAWFINEFKPLARTIFSFMFYAPSLAGGVFIWQIAFSSDAYGYVNSLLLSFGIIQEPIAWLSSSSWIVPIVVMVQIWSGLGVSFLANLSGLQNVNNELYEAGALDGIRNRWQELWYITLPSMKPQLMFGAVMSITQSFSVGDVTSALCGFPSTDYAAHTIINHLTDYGSTKFEMGYASAIATILFAVMIGTNKLIQRVLSGVGK